MSGAVPVAVNGFTWTAALVGFLNLLVGGALVALFKSWPSLKKVAADREANLLKERADEMASMREELAEMRARLEITSEELRVVRHDLANANHSLDLLMALIESNPEKAADHAKRVMEQRALARQQVIEEKVALTKARVSKIGSTS